MRRQCVPGPLPLFGRGLGTRLTFSSMVTIWLLIFEKILCSFFVFLHSTE